ncbi:hypothetical protein TrCOL_g3523 [Triparma columacea]|uniref:SRR1-like domain-containing protein n=1 Tax=Triparma columacea TaxID=722753 RepID=A0A9W7L1U1_9STRA|nr:hypothetical protein TrCOL_g3523 [Triparma columacea]
MADSEWVTVGSKKGKNKKKGKRRVPQKVKKSTQTSSELILDPPSVESVEITDGEIADLDGKLNPNASWVEVTEALLPPLSLEELKNATDLVVLGIGSPSTCKSSSSTSYQFRLASYLADVLKPANKVIYDPAHTARDLSYLSHHGWHVPHYPKNEKGCRGDWTSSNGVWFMPHCPRELYKLVLENNKESRVVIIGNSFTQYVDQIDRGGDFGVLLSERHWREVPLGNKVMEEVGEAFSFTSIMIVEAEETSECPGYIKRIARSMALTKVDRTSEITTSSKPEWR